MTAFGMGIGETHRLFPLNDILSAHPAKHVSTSIAADLVPTLAYWSTLLDCPVRAGIDIIGLKGCTFSLMTSFDSFAL